MSCARAALLALLVASVLPPRIAAAQNQTTSIAGTVVARETGRAIAGAGVTIEGTDRTTTSNAVGHFRFEGAASGPVVLVVRAGGFLERRVPGIQPAAGGVEPTIELDVTPNFMDRVQVTATKTPQSVGDVAAQTDIVDRSTIDSRGDQTLVQAIAHVPGAIVSTQLGLFESVMLRGLPRGDPEFTSTLLLIDGVPQTNSNNGARVVALPINDAGSIEVLRGPNSALYGRTAIGGAVNVRTAEPTPDTQAGVDLTGGEFEMLKGVAKLSGPLQHWGGYYVSVAKERNHGYFDNQTTSDFSVGNEALFAKLTFAPDSQSFGSVSVNRVTSDNSTPTNEPIVGGRLLHDIDSRFNRVANFNIPGPNYHQAESRATLNYTRTLAPWARAVEVFGYRAVQHKFINDGDLIGSPYDLDAHTFTMYPFSQQMDEDVFFQELRLELTPTWGSRKSALTVGGSYEWNNGTLASDFIFTDPDLGGWTLNYLDPVIPAESEWQHETGTRKYRLGIGALFAQYMVEPSSRLILTAGGRYDRLAMRNARDGGSNIDATFDAFSPKASATVRVIGREGGAGPTLNAYGAYSHAFLPPRRPSSLVPADVPLKLEPEDIDNYEGGLKGSALDGRLSLEATYFWMKENGVVLSTRQGPFFLPTNAGEQRYKGVETGATVAVSPRLSLYLNAAFYRNRFGHFVIESEDGDEILTGNRLPISPDRVVNWGARCALSEALEATLNVKHVGGVQTNRENTFTLDPYSVVDAALSWTRGPVRLTLSAHNLLSEAYYGNGDGDTADPGRPRQLLLTTSLLFK